TIPFLKNHLSPVPEVDPNKGSLLIRQLDSPRFSIREEATRKLESLGESVEDALKVAQASHLPSEVRRRIEMILERIDARRTSPKSLRLIRSVAILEQIGTPEAQRQLDKLAQGARAASLTQAAKAALWRSGKPRSALP